MGSLAEIRLAPQEAVSSGSTLLAQACLAQYLEPLQYILQNCPYRKTPKYSDIQKIAVMILKIWTDADRMANSVDPDQTASLEQSDLCLYCLPRSFYPKL